MCPDSAIGVIAWGCVPIVPLRLMVLIWVYRDIHEVRWVSTVMLWVYRDKLVLVIVSLAKYVLVSQVGIDKRREVWYDVCGAEVKGEALTGRRGTSHSPAVPLGIPQEKVMPPWCGLLQVNGVLC
jgi:hypothetical protein